MLVVEERSTFGGQPTLRPGRELYAMRVVVAARRRRLPLRRLLDKSVLGGGVHGVVGSAPRLDDIVVICSVGQRTTSAENVVAS